ncbi:hypothetical protein MRX96_004204 [Rhipicephalus microplus]
MTNSEAGMATHRSIHRRVSPHKCDVCGRSYVRQSTLLYHIRTHTGERAHTQPENVCPECTATFVTKSSLDHHVNNNLLTGKLHHHRRQVTPQETFKTSPSSHFLSSGSVRVYSKLKQNASLESEMASGKNNVEVLPQIEKVCVPFADAAHQATESSSATSVALSTVLTSFDECKVVGAEGSEQAYVPDTNLVPLHAIAVASLKDGEDDNEFNAMEDKEALAAMIECTSEPLKTAVTEKSLGDGRAAA